MLILFNDLNVKYVYFVTGMSGVASYTQDFHNFSPQHLHCEWQFFCLMNNEQSARPPLRVSDFDLDERNFSGIRK